MKAYLGDAQLKQDFVTEIINHQEADQIIQGTYGEGSGKNFRGCAVGCSIHSLNRLKRKRLSFNDHEAYEEQLGIPASLAYLEDRLFEGLPVDLAKQWPLRFSQAVNVGADLSAVTGQFIVWLLGTRNTVYKSAIPDGKKVITKVRKLYERQLAGEVITDAEWGAAESAAWSAAYEKMADKLIALIEDAR